MSEQTQITPPRPTLLDSFRFDALAGLLVFLIALPLCLAIAKASNFPPIAGIWTAVIGGLVCTFISNSQMTIKGPAAGLIVIVAGAVTELGNEFGPDLAEAEQLALGYTLTLGVGVVAGVIQILFGLFRAGKLGDFFPLPAVHGMLASIGLTIIAKQAYVVFGVDAPKVDTPLELFAALPGALPGFNPEIAAIGLVSLAILFLVPLIKNTFVRKIPVPMLVLLVAVPMGIYFDLDHPHPYHFPASFFDLNHPARFEVGPHYLVAIPNVLENPASAFAFPNFAGVLTLTGIKYIVLFALIGSLESLLSAKAIDLLDPQGRRTNLNRDLTGVGISNTIAALIGGLPMISEIVRSSANINNGAKTKLANFFHGLCLLAFALFLPHVIHQIPLAALGAMLVYTGFRLASPSEFWKTYKIGVPQFIVFVGTIAVTLATDLLIGIFAGVAIKAIIHLCYGVPFTRLFRARIETRDEQDAAAVIVVRDAAVFSTWLTVQGAARQAAQTGFRVVIDLSQTRLVDHSVMEKLHELECEFCREGKKLEVVGLEGHTPCSEHPYAARRRNALVA